MSLRSICNFVVLCLLCGCGTESIDKRTDPTEAGSFSLSNTSDEGWVEINAYGHELYYPIYSENDPPKRLTRTPITIAPFIEAESVQRELVGVVLTIMPQFKRQACADAKSDSSFEELPSTSRHNADWAGVNVSNDRDESGRYFFNVQAFFKYRNECVQLFLYEATFDGVIFPFHYDADTELAFVLRKIIESYRKT